MDNSRTYLDQILALGFCHQWLQLGRGERVDKTGFGDDEEKHLGASEDGQFICLDRRIGLVWAGPRMADGDGR